MKALLLLAATGVGTLVAFPHLPDMTTVANEVQAAFGSVSTRLSQVSQPAQPGPTDQTDPSVQPSQDGTASGNPETPFVAQASPEDVRHTYGEPQHVERSVYGETWYYPVYIIYFRNGFIHRVHRSTLTASTTTRPVAPFGSVGVTPGSTTTSLTPRTVSEPWRFSTNSSLGTVKLGGSGVQRPTYFEHREIGGESNTNGEPHTTGTTYLGPNYSTNHSGSTSHTGSGVSTVGSTSTGMCNRPTTSTVTAPHPVVVQHSAPVTTAPVYGRVGY